MRVLIVNRLDMGRERFGCLEDNDKVDRGLSDRSGLGCRRSESGGVVRRSDKLWI
jgi:hypothetical protein